MEKKKWTQPHIDCVQFQANEYISSCSLNLTCDQFGSVFMETTGDNTATNCGNSLGAGAFYNAYTTENSFADPKQIDYDDYYQAANAVLSDENNIWYSYFKTYDQLVGTINPNDPYNHTNSDSNITITKDSLANGTVHKGYIMQSNNGMSTVMSSAYFWHNPDGTDLHATYYRDISFS